MTASKLIISPLSRVVEENGDSVEIAIFRLEHTGWNLEIVASDGCVTVWEVVFQSDEAAFVRACRDRASQFGKEIGAQRHGRRALF